MNKSAMYVFDAPDIVLELAKAVCPDTEFPQELEDVEVHHASEQEEMDLYVFYGKEDCSLYVIGLFRDTPKRTDEMCFSIIRRMVRLSLWLPKRAREVVVMISEGDIAAAYVQDTTQQDHSRTMDLSDFRIKPGENQSVDEMIALLRGEKTDAGTPLGKKIQAVLAETKDLT